MAIRSAEVILVWTYFLAACTDRSVSSGPIEVRSKKSTITRLLLSAWSASLAVRSFGGFAGCVGEAAPLFSCAGPAAAVISGCISRFSKSKREILLLQVRYQLALLVMDHHVHQDKFAFDPDAVEPLLVLVLLRLLGRRLCADAGKNECAHLQH